MGISLEAVHGPQAMMAEGCGRNLMLISAVDFGCLDSTYFPHQESSHGCQHPLSHHLHLNHRRVSSRRSAVLRSAVIRWAGSSHYARKSLRVRRLQLVVLRTQRRNLVTTNDLQIQCEDPGNVLICMYRISQPSRNRESRRLDLPRHGLEAAACGVG